MFWQGVYIKDEIFAANPSTEGAMYCPIILGSNKTTVSVGTGHVQYHPMYLSIRNPHNTLWHAHRNAIAFLTISKCVYSSNILKPLSHNAFQATAVMTTASFFVISNSSCIMHLWWLFSGWMSPCATCTHCSHPGLRCMAHCTNLEYYAVQCTPNHMRTQLEVLDSDRLWDEYGINEVIVVSY